MPFGGEITIDTTDTQNILRNYCKQLYAKKFETQGEMDKLQEKYNFPKLNEVQAESLNRPITADEIEAVIKKKNKKPPSTLKPWTRWFHRRILQCI